MEVEGSPSPSTFESPLKNKGKQVIRTPASKASSDVDSSDEDEDDSSSSSSEVEILEQETILVNPRPQPVKVEPSPSQVVTRARQHITDNKPTPKRSKGRLVSASPPLSARARKGTGKTPVSRKKSGASLSSSQIRHRASLEEVIPSLDESSLHAITQDYETDFVSSFFLIFSSL